jgi:hypothetical protein
MSQALKLYKKRKEKDGLQRDIECISMSCANCKHGLFLSRRIYCSLLQERIDTNDIIPEYCQYFEPEPLEYKLFRRT